MDGQAGEALECLHEVGQARQPGGLRELAGELEAPFAPGPEDPVLDPQEGDVVEHQRDDDLVDPESRLEDARDEAPQGSGSHARQGHQGHEEDGWGVVRQDRQEDDGARAPGAHQQLTLRPDVPQPHPEGDRTGEAGEDERRGHDQRVRQDTDGAEGGAQDVHVGADRVATDEGDDDAADDQRHGDSTERGRQRQPARHVETTLEAQLEGAQASGCVVAAGTVVTGRGRWAGRSQQPLRAAHRQCRRSSGARSRARPRPGRRTCP